MYRSLLTIQTSANSTDKPLLAQLCTLFNPYLSLSFWHQARPEDTFHSFKYQFFMLLKLTTKYLLYNLPQIHFIL